jgi:hypothetical protein
MVNLGKKGRCSYSSSSQNKSSLLQGAASEGGSIKSFQCAGYATFTDHLAVGKPDARPTASTAFFVPIHTGDDPPPRECLANRQHSVHARRCHGMWVKRGNRGRKYDVHHVERMTTIPVAVRRRCGKDGHPRLLVSRLCRLVNLPTQPISCPPWSSLESPPATRSPFQDLLPLGISRHPKGRKKYRGRPPCEARSRSSLAHRGPWRPDANSSLTGPCPRSAERKGTPVPRKYTPSLEDKLQSTALTPRATEKGGCTQEVRGSVGTDNPSEGLPYPTR